MLYEYTPAFISLNELNIFEFIQIMWDWIQNTGYHHQTFNCLSEKKPEAESSCISFSCFPTACTRTSSIVFELQLRGKIRAHSSSQSQTITVVNKLCKQIQFFCIKGQRHQFFSLIFFTKLKFTLVWIQLWAEISIFRLLTDLNQYDGPDGPLTS